MERAEAYLEAGADVLFIEAPENRDQMEGVAARFAARVPLLANMVEGGRTPLASTAELGRMGFRIVIFPGGTVRAAAHALRDYFAALKRDGTTDAFSNRMFDFKGLQGMLGTEAILKDGQKYQS